jgi:hypothetical protein
MVWRLGDRIGGVTALLQATKDFDAASGAARDWFREALGSSR